MLRAQLPPSVAVPLDLRKPTVLVTFLIAVTKCLIEGREEEVFGGGALAV